MTTTADLLLIIGELTVRARELEALVAQCQENHREVPPFLKFMGGKKDEDAEDGQR